MEIELLPAVSLLPETLSVLVAPEEMLRALNGNPHLQQFRILFITGIRSGILEHAGSQRDRADSEEGLHLRPSCGPSWRRIATPS